MEKKKSCSDPYTKLRFTREKEERALT